MSNLKLDKINKETGEITGSVELTIKVYPIAEPKGNTKAFASIGIDDTFGVHGVSVIEGKNGLFVSMPQTKDSKGEFRDVFHPVTSDGRKTLNEAVLAGYVTALDDLQAKQESTLAKIQERKQAIAGKTALDKPADKDTIKTAMKKVEAR